MTEVSALTGGIRGILHRLGGPAAVGEWSTQAAQEIAEYVTRPTPTSEQTELVEAFRNKWIGDHEEMLDDLSSLIEALTPPEGDTPMLTPDEEAELVERINANPNLHPLPEGDTLSDEVVELVDELELAVEKDTRAQEFSGSPREIRRATERRLAAREAVTAALQSRVSPRAGVQEALEPFVERLEMLEDNCRKLGCGVPAETNVRTSWLRKLRAALPAPPEPEA